MGQILAVPILVEICNFNIALWHAFKEKHAMRLTAGLKTMQKYLDMECEDNYKLVHKPVSCFDGKHF